MERKINEGSISEGVVLQPSEGSVEKAELNPELGERVQLPTEPKPVNWRPWVRNPQNPM